MFADRFSRRERRLAAATVVVAVAFGLFKVRIEPAARRWRQLADQCAAAEAEVTVIEATLKLKKRIENEYQEFRPLLAGTRSHEEEMADLLEQVYLAATRNSVDVHSIDPLPAEYREACRLLGARVVLRGRVVPFCRFAQHLSTGSPLTFMRDLEIRALSEAPNLEVTITVVRTAALPEETSPADEAGTQ